MNRQQFSCYQRPGHLSLNSQIPFAGSEKSSLTGGHLGTCLDSSPICCDPVLSTNVVESGCSVSSTAVHAAVSNHCRNLYVPKLVGAYTHRNLGICRTSLCACTTNILPLFVHIIFSVARVLRLKFDPSTASIGHPLKSAGARVQDYSCATFGCETRKPDARFLVSDKHTRNYSCQTTIK